MLRHALAVGLVMGFGVSLAACSSVDTASGGVHAPCTRDKDCKSGLTCAHGVCIEPDGGGDDADANRAMGER